MIRRKFPQRKLGIFFALIFLESSSCCSIQELVLQDWGCQTKLGWMRRWCYRKKK